MTTRKKKTEQTRNDAAAILRYVKSQKDPVTPEQIKAVCGMSDLDWFSTRWRDAIAMARDKGLTSTGAGPNRVYQIKGKQ